MDGNLALVENIGQEYHHKQHQDVFHQKLTEISGDGLLTIEREGAVVSRSGSLQT